MPVSPTTTAARAAAARMFAFPNLSGVAQIVRQLATEDATTLGALGTLIAGQSPPAGMTAALTLAQQRCASVVNGGGNVALWPYLVSSSVDVLAAASFAEGLAADPAGAKS